MNLRGLAALLAMLAALVSCSGAGTAATSTSPPTTAAPTTSTSAEDPCPDAFCVRYSIDPDATWSDGQPVVAADFAHTFTVVSDDASGGGNPGYDLVTDLLEIDEKTFVIAMSEVFSPWRTLFDIVLPAHVAYDPAAPGPTTGPFTFVEWIEGDRIVLANNPFYTVPEGQVGGDVGELTFVFPADLRTMVGDLEEGAVDVINPRPLAWMTEEIAGMESVEHTITPGPYWEHIDFNHDDPLLSQVWVRDAFALALDREAILDETVRAIDPAAETLGNTIWMLGSAHYEDHVRQGFDPVRAEQTLMDNFCVKGEDGIYSCQGRRMSFVWATTVGDELREAQVDLAVDQLGAIGIEVVPRLLTPSELFSQPVMFGSPGAWQIVSFSWKAAADPFLGDSTYQCEGAGPHGMGALNVNRYCDPVVDDLVASTREILDPEGRAGAYNEADTAYLGGLAVIPLYQKPALLAWSSDLVGPMPNPGATDLWNVGSWTGKTTVVVALDSEPASLVPLVSPDDATAMVRGALYLGAFAVSPEMEYVPSLVAQAETIVSED